MRIRKRLEKYLECKIRKVILEVLEEKKYNIKDGLQKNALVKTCKWIQENVALDLMFEDRFELLYEAINRIEINDGLVLEFGVYKGETINYIAKNIKGDLKNVFGFDSFEGLQEPWIYRAKGGFSDVEGNIPDVPSNVKLIKGYFEDTLQNFINNNNNKAKISFIHIDSDLYSSAKTIFRYLERQIVNGTVIVFDEFFNYPNWEKGEFKAWNEFVQEYNVKFEYIGFSYQKTENKKSGNQLAVKIISKD